MSDRQKLATYQAKLLDALHAAKTLGEAEAALQSLAADADMTDDLGQVDPRMLRIAMQLTKKWGVPRTGK